MADLSTLSDDELRSFAARARAKVTSKPLSEQQSKYILHGEEMDRANKGMLSLQVPEVDPKTGETSTFDPSGYIDGANVAMAGNRFTYPFASEKGQQQDAYNNAFAQSLSYGRSMASFRPEELQAAFDTFLPRIGDKPKQVLLKTAARDTVTKAVQSGDPRLPQIISGLTGGIDFTGGGAAPPAGATAPGAPPPAVTGTPAGASAATAPPGVAPASTPPPSAPVPQPATGATGADYKTKALAAFKSGPDTPERRRMVQELLTE